MSMDEPDATAIQFAPPDDNAPGGPWQLEVIVTGSGFETRGLPLAASIGAVMVEAILPFPDGSGFSGYLATTPNDGDVLSFGFAVSTVTELAYHPGEVA
jgi:hypothetical protein